MLLLQVVGDFPPGQASDQRMDAMNAALFFALLHTFLLPSDLPPCMIQQEGPCQVWTPQPCAYHPLELLRNKCFLYKLVSPLQQEKMD